jgi:hypothetical protein
MKNKFNKNRDIIKGHYGVMPKIPTSAWSQVMDCAHKVKMAIDKLSSAATKFEGPSIKK